MLRRVLQSLGLSVAVLLCGDTSAMAQPNSEPLRLDGLFPVGGRNTLTEAWGTLQFGIDNRGDDPRQARVVVFYPSQPDLHYTRDVWIPAHARVISWVSIGPAPELKSTVSREIAYQLFDRTGGGNREVHTRDPEHILTRAEPYRRRDPTTAVYLDASVVETSDPNPLDDPKSGDSESLRFVQVFRDTRNLSERVSIIQDRYLPPSPEAFDGIDQFVLAGNRLAADPAGMQALRHWVLHGGTLWVLLDRVNPEVVAPILGDGLRFQVVGRTGLTTVRVRRAKQDRDQAEKWDFDRPVDLVQVLLSGSEEVLFDANDWPAAFSQTLGRGRVIFTALGPRGWYQDRTPRDPPSHFEHVPDLPVPRWTLGFLSGYIFPEPEKEKVGPDALAPMLAAEVGYEVVGRGTATGILAAFLVGVLVLAILLRRSRWPEIIGLGAPAVAVAATAAFLLAGVNSRRAVPSTAAAVAMVSVSPDCREEQWHGLFAVYQPSSGVVQVGTDRGGQLDFDQSGLEGLTRRRVETDLDSWHWENLSFPAGVRMGQFRSTRRTGVSAAGRFGPGGFEGRLNTGTFRNPAEAVIQTRSGTIYAAHLNPDGTFNVGQNDALPAGQYLSTAVLNDRQQRRQDLYRRLLDTGKKYSYLDHDRLFVWCEFDDLPFAVDGAERKVGTALLSVPIEYEPSGSGELTLPGGFVPYTAFSAGRSYPPRLNHTEPIRTRLRFQLPDCGRPFSVERATFQARVRAPGRRFTVSGIAEGQSVQTFEQLNPAGSVRIEIAEPRFLRTDAEGGLFLEFAMSEMIGADGREKSLKSQETGLKWEIEAINLEVRGRLVGN